MTWYYMPSISAPDTEASSSPSDTPASPLAPWLTLSGTATQRPYSWRGWARRDWIEHLSGLTSTPSTLARGLAVWTSSLPASPVNPSRRPVRNVALTMIDISGRWHPGSSLTWDRPSCSWRTSPTLFELDGYLTSSPTLPTSGSMRNGVCYPQPTLAPPTDGNDSGCWPTSTAQSAIGNGFRSVGRGTPLLKGAASMWPTPTARDDQKTPEAHLAMKRRMGGNRTAITSLTVMSKMWPTGQDGWRSGGNPTTTGSHDLHQVASLHLPTTTPAGNDGSLKADLNPRFVAALMGLPLDWLTPYISAETDSSPKQQLPLSPSSPNDSTST